jgi:hypothetical protein
LYPAQSFPFSCDDSTVVNGAFSLSAAVCTGVNWVVTVGSGARTISCTGANPITPPNCWCGTGSAGASGFGCDAGARFDAGSDRGFGAPSEHD